MIQDKFSMEQQDNIFYAKRNIVDSIYSQSKLEGIAVTFPDTQEIYEGRSVAGLSVEDIVKVNNLKHGWEFLFDTVDYPLDLRYVQSIKQRNWCRNRNKCWGFEKFRCQYWWNILEARDSNL